MDLGIRCFYPTAWLRLKFHFHTENSWPKFSTFLDSFSGISDQGFSLNIARFFIVCVHASMLCADDEPGQCVDSALHTSPADPTVLSSILQTRSAHKWGIAGTQCSWGQEHCRKTPIFFLSHAVVMNPVYIQLNNATRHILLLFQSTNATISGLIDRFTLNSITIIFLWNTKKSKTLLVASKYRIDYTSRSKGVAQKNNTLLTWFPGLHLLTIIGYWVELKTQFNQNLLKFSFQL